MMEAQEVVRCIEAGQAQEAADVWRRHLVYYRDEMLGMGKAASHTTRLTSPHVNDASGSCARARTRGCGIVLTRRDGRRPKKFGQAVAHDTARCNIGQVTGCLVARPIWST